MPQLVVVVKQADLNEIEQRAYDEGFRKGDNEFPNRSAFIRYVISEYLKTPVREQKK